VLKDLLGLQRSVSRACAAAAPSHSRRKAAPLELVVRGRMRDSHMPSAAATATDAAAAVVFESVSWVSARSDGRASRLRRCFADHYASKPVR